MADLSDFMEDRLLEIALGKTSYQVPTVIRVSVLDDTATYTVTVNGDDFSYPAVGGDVELDVLTGLKTAIDLGGAPLTTSLFVDNDGENALKIAQDATYTPLHILVSATAAGDLSGSREVYAALYTTAVGEDASGTEVAGLGYTRETLSFAAVASGESATDADVTFGPAGVGGWGQVTHAAIFDDLTAGNLIFHGALVAAKDVLENDTFTFFTGTLTLAMK